MDNQEPVLQQQTPTPNGASVASTPDLNASPAQNQAPIQTQTTTLPSQEVKKGNGKKLLVGLVIATIVALGVFAIFSLRPTPSIKKSVNGGKSNSSQTVNTSIAPSPTSTDPQLDQETQKIDNSMKNLDKDVKSVDQGFNDTPVNLN
mgnify:FL=1